MTTIGTIELIAKIDTSQYEKGAEKVKQKNREMEGSADTSSKKTSAVWGKVAKAGLAAVAAGFVALSTRVDDAVKRIDTLVAFPRVLQAMGISAKEAKVATSTLSDELQGLPTPLQDGARAVQQFVSSGLGVDRATKAFLGVNNALLATGAGAQDTQIVMDSLQRVISAGNGDVSTMQAIMSRMPTVLSALSKETGKSQGELYKLFSQNPQELLDHIIRLNEKGGAGMASLEEQAREATSGIGTAFSNMGNSIDRGLQAIVTAIGGGDLERGQARIANAITNVGRAVEIALGAVGKFISRLIELGSSLSPLANVFIKNRGAVVVFASALGYLYIVSKIRAGFIALQGAITLLGSGMVASTVRTVGFSGALTALGNSAALTALKMNILWASLTIGFAIWAKYLFDLVKAISLGTQLDQTWQKITRSVINSIPFLGQVTSALGLLGSAVFGNKIRADALATANDRVKAAQDRVKEASNQLKDAQLQLQGSSLAVERAQKNYTEAVKQYGPKSLEAREAAHQLKSAQKQQADASSDAKNKTNGLKDAQKNLGKEDSARKTMEKTADKGRSLADAMSSAANKIGDVIGKLRELGNSKGGKAVRGQILRSVGLPAFAGGTNYAPGGLSVVGEEGPELVDLPRGSKVYPHKESMRMASNPQFNISINPTGIMSRSRADERDIAKGLVKALNQELVAKGYSPIGQGAI